MAAGAVLVLLAAYGVTAMRSWRAGRDLPPPPESQAMLPAIREHLRERYDAAQAAPSSAEAVGALCLAYQADMFYDLAERCYQVVQALAPGEWRWTYYRGVIAGERGRADDLAAIMREVLQRQPMFGPAWLRLGDAEFKAARYDAADQAWARAAASPEPARGEAMPAHHLEVPLSAHAALGRARVALTRGDTPAAARMLREVVAAVPEFGPALRLLADAERAGGRQQESTALLERANRLPAYAPYADPMVDVLIRESRSSTLLLRASSEASLAVNAEWSEFLTRRAVEFDPANPDAIVKLGRVLRTVGRSDEALEYFRRYHDLVPADPQGLAHIGGALSDLGRFDEAEPVLREALRGLDDAITHYNLGLLLALTDRPEEAMAEYARALQRDPNHADARMNLAIAYARRGDTARGIHELTYVLERDPENPLAHTNMGILLLQQGQRARAVAELQRALAIAPGLPQAEEALRAAQQ